MKSKHCEKSDRAVNFEGERKAVEPGVSHHIKVNLPVQDIFSRL